MNIETELVPEYYIVEGDDLNSVVNAIDDERKKAYRGHYDMPELIISRAQYRILMRDAVTQSITNVMEHFQDNRQLKLFGIITHVEGQRIKGSDDSWRVDKEYPKKRVFGLVSESPLFSKPTSADA